MMKASRERACPPSPARRPSERGTAFYGSLGMVAACLALLAMVLLPGCAERGHAHDVDPSRAREALQTALEQWKAGAEPRALATSATPMTVQDLDWAGGARLNDFEIVGDGDARGANLSIQARLTLQNKKGKAVKKTVWYLVGTSPAVTVFRDMLRR